MNNPTYKPGDVLISTPSLKKTSNKEYQNYLQHNSYFSIYMVESIEHFYYCVNKINISENEIHKIYRPHTHSDLQGFRKMSTRDYRNILMFNIKKHNFDILDLVKSMDVNIHNILYPKCPKNSIQWLKNVICLYGLL